MINLTEVARVLMRTRRGPSWRKASLPTRFEYWVHFWRGVSDCWVTTIRAPCARGQILPLLTWRRAVLLSRYRDSKRSTTAGSECWVPNTQKHGGHGAILSVPASWQPRLRAHQTPKPLIRKAPTSLAALLTVPEGR